MKYRGLLSMLVCAQLFGGAGQLQAQDAIYTIHPPALSVPQGKPGEIRRSISQYDNWTLICDENRKLKKMVCNVTQSVHDQDGKVIFSWSLAASDDGRPFLLLRTLPEADRSKSIRLVFEGLDRPIGVDIMDCDQNVCLGQSPVGPLLRKQIEKESVAHISYMATNGQSYSFDAPLSGLKEAVASIQ